jgi:6-phosphogluconolactonase (cycloisomerase 2 family)
MMFRGFGRMLLAMAFSLGLAPLLTSCGAGHTIGFAYVLSSPSSTSSSVWIYKVNSATGQLYQAGLPSVPNTNYASPVYSVVSPDNNYLYVLYGPTTNGNTGLPNPNGQDAIVVYGINHESNIQAGTITPLQTYNTGGTEPVSLAIDPSGKFLYAVDFYQEGFSNNFPGKGDLTVYDIGASGTLTIPSTCSGGLGTLPGSICFYGVGLSPRAATQLANGSYVYVANTGLLSTPCSATVSGFSVGANGLTPIDFTVPSGASCTNPYPANSLPLGGQPWAITSDSSSSFVYVTDVQQSVIYATQVTPSTGNLTPLANYPVGSNPENLLVDPTGAYLYVANASSNNISGFIIGPAATPLTPIGGSPFSTGTVPLCMSAQSSYLYNVNQVSGSVSGFVIASSSSTAPGSLSVVHDQPFQVSTSPSSSPTCLAIANSQ